MMNDIQIFNNAEFGDIRTVVVDDEPWFVGNDVAKALKILTQCIATRKILPKEILAEIKSILLKILILLLRQEKNLKGTI